MRLTENERDNIIAACRSVAGDRPFSLYLFGSRVKDDERGGDIDLLLVVAPGDLIAIRLLKHHFLQEIKARIGMQKIDFLIASPQALSQDEFLRNASASGLLLFKTAVPGAATPP